jgi:inhibitor of KinA sporulation pathway (predicted exonuclease)
MIRQELDSRGMRVSSPIITIFDLEYTAWECSMARHWLTPGEYREVVQIGAVKLNADTFAELDAFDTLVRPRINPKLSAYFQNLTGITQDAVTARSVDFAQAYARFLDFAGDGPIAAFGRDEQVLVDNLRLYGIEGAHPLPVFYDLRGWFAVQGLDPRGMLSCDIAPALGMPFIGQTHNALNDARSLAASMEAMNARGGIRVRPAA